MSDSAPLLPTLYIPHGGGPCFFMDWTMGPPDTFDRMAGWLREFGRRHAEVKALLVISAHWEAEEVTVQTAARPPLLFDYYGFPEHTYKLTWPAPGSPALAGRVGALLSEAGIEVHQDPLRGFDHGTFIPLKVAFPEARIPTVQLSLHTGLDAATHLSVGRALAPLRSEGVLVVGSGLSFHNMQAFMRPGDSLARSREFDSWLGRTCASHGRERASALASWSEAPWGRFCHPREEHLLPLMVVAGAAEHEPGRRVFEDVLMGVVISAFEFGGRSSDPLLPSPQGGLHA